MKKKIIYPFVLIFLGSASLLAQQKESSIGIVLNVIVPKQGEYFTPQVIKILQTKCEAMASKNGISGDRYNADFLLVPQVIVDEFETTPTAPPKTLVKLDVVLKIADGRTKEIFASYSMRTGGVGNNKNAAYYNAVKMLKTSGKELKQFFNEGKEKIVEYYKGKCENIINEASMLQKQKKHEAALSKLMSIPHASEFCYEKASKKIDEVYAAYLDHRCEEVVRMADVSVQNGNFSRARCLMATVPTDIPCYAKVKAMHATIDNKICSATLSRAKAELSSQHFDSAAIYISRVSKQSSCSGEAAMMWKTVARQRNEMYLQKANAAKAAGDLEKAAEFASYIPANSEYASSANTIITTLEAERQQKYKEQMEVMNKEMDYNHQQALAEEQTKVMVESFRNEHLLELAKSFAANDENKKQLETVAYELVE